jgi:hypothetical protein
MERNDRLWDAADPTDANPTEWSAASAAPPSVPAPNRLGGGRRGLATAMLAAGLLIIGGVAAVSAADPSASSAPDATSQPADPGASAQPDDTSGHQRGDCPEDGTNGSGGDGGTDSSPDASPDASDSDV